MTADTLINAIPQLGLGAFSMYILWKFGEKHSERLKEKDVEAATERAVFRDEIRQSQAAFREAAQKHQEFLIDQNLKMADRMVKNSEIMSQTAEVMSQNTKVMERVTLALKERGFGRRKYDKPQV